MPELPEVETICRGLTRHCVGSRVLSSHVHRPGFIRGSRDRAALFTGLVIARVHRHGKQFAMESECGRVMLFHLGMSGSVTIRPHESLRAPHVHVHWILKRSEKVFELHHKDPRRFGYLHTFKNMLQVRKKIWSELGADALALKPEFLLQKFKTRRGAVKAVLLDQSVTAGIGNIYADESLFQSGIHPLRSAGSLSLRELKALTDRIRSVLEDSIRSGGSTIQDHADASGRAGKFQKRHKVYGRGGLPCVVCGASLNQILCQQRTTVFCPRCQPRRPGKSK